MWRLPNLVHLKKIDLQERLPSINAFVREHVRANDKQVNRANKEALVKDKDIRAYIALPYGNGTPIEVLFDYIDRARQGDLLEEINEIKEKARLILVFPIKRLKPNLLSRSMSRSTSRLASRSAIIIPRLNNKRSKSQLRDSDKEKDDEVIVKEEPKVELIKAEDSDDSSSLSSFELQKAGPAEEVRDKGRVEHRGKEFQANINTNFDTITVIRVSRRKRTPPKRKQESLE